MNFETQLEEKTAYVQEVIARYFPAGEGFAARISDVMRYSLEAGGKRIRPLLLYESCLIHHADPAAAEPCFAAIEMIHTHSLMPDDLPARDDDELRRGRPTAHVIFGEAAAILAGDALLNLAYETVLDSFSDGYEQDRQAVPGGCLMAREVAADHLARRWRALRILAEKTGRRGMLGGQSVDVENDRRSDLVPDRATLDFIYEAKTAALLEAPLMIGAVLGGAEAEEISRMEKIGSRLGRIFQIRDDILDLTATEEVLGKPVRSDVENEKITMVSLLGREMAHASGHDCTEEEMLQMGILSAEKQIRHLTEETLQMLREVPGDTEFLEQLIQKMSDRRR